MGPLSVVIVALVVNVIPALLTGVRPTHLEEVVLLAALPPAFSGIVIAGREQTYVDLASSTLIVSVVAFAGAAPLWTALARHLAG